MSADKKISKGVVWTSYILQSILGVMFLMGALGNLLQTERAVQSAAELGYPETSIMYLGIVLLFATILYLIPKTTFIGGLFLTAYLGGAVATHVIHNDSVLYIMAPVIFDFFVWLGIWLRDEKFRTIIYSTA